MSRTIRSVSMEMLIKKLASEATLLFSRQEKIRFDLMRWRNLLMQIDAVLDDAEEKQMTRELVKMWLDEAQNLAFDIEDLLEELETEAFRRKLLHEEPASDHLCTSKFRKLIPSCCTNFAPRTVKFDYMMMNKVREVNVRLIDLAAGKDTLKLKESSGENSKEVGLRVPTTSLVNEAEIYGREKDKEIIVELLFSDKLSADRVFSVIPIVGMCGLGKTTLAQLVYNDNRVLDSFDLKAWICVSDDFDVVRLTKLILHSISTNHQLVDSGVFDLLQVELKKQLSGKKFLLVLDDVWTGNYDAWSDLTQPFKAGAWGSVIIVTTRNLDVAAMMGHFPAYEPTKLCHDDCLRIFDRHSFGTRFFSKHQHRKEVREKIVMKCDGLPLVAKTLGSILRVEDDPNVWEDVLNGNIFNLRERYGEDRPALRVSYHYLPWHLKQCFQYCSLFPKNYEFQEEELLLLWNAMGFFDTQDSENQGEELGHSSFQLLHSRSFFQQSRNDTSRFVMHDLVNDLAQWAAGEMYFRMEDKLAVKMQQRFSRRLRHLSYIPGEYDGEERFEAVCDVRHLRTFLPVMLSNVRGKFHYLADRVLHKFFNLQALRVFSLQGYCIFKLPNSIGDLKFLRYLNLSETKLKTLPESINTLYSLRTLMLEDCHRLRKLCADMGNLIKLHHLNNSNTNLLEEMPFGIGKLTCLQTLCNFAVGKDVGSGLQELKFLMHLRGTLTISRLENVRDVGDAKAARLTDKKHLKVLLLQWTSSTTDDSTEPETETELLDMLKPHQNLEQFCISGYGGTKFPNWLGDSSFSNLVTLRFQGCNICTSLPSVGQLPSLKNLEVCGMSRIKSVGLEFYGNSCPIAFPSLETLCFEDMIEWEVWIPHGTGQEVEGFPRLRELSLRDCFKLSGKLPECLPSLEKLVIKRCEQLVVSIPSLAALCKLEIDGCKKVVWRSTTDFGLSDSVVCRNLSHQVFLEGPLKQQLPELEQLKINNIKELAYLWQDEKRLLQDISSLERLKIESCPILQSLVAEEEQDQQHPCLSCRLEYLEIVHCQGLLKLPQALFSLSSLREVKIWDCSSLVSLPKAWMHNSNPSLVRLNIVHCHSLTSIQLPSGLKQLEIKHCDNLRTLIEEEDIHHSSIKRYTSLLEYLVIRWCPSLTSLFSTKELPATLEHLDVRYCSNLVFLSWSGNLPQALKYLYVYECSKLESIAERLDKNTSLEIIRIRYCENLELLPGGLHKLYHLQEICISDCPRIVSFPDGVLPSKKLTKLEIAGCVKLEALPNGMHNLASLQKLEIRDLPRIVSSPKEGFPTNLQSLEIHDMKIWKILIQWGVNRFTSLRQLIINGCQDVVSLSSAGIGLVLPASLNHLEIQNFQNLESLSSFGDNLTSLEFLGLSDCPKLKHFPENGLPYSLLKLSVNDCPLIEKKCRKDGGQYWPLIARIPCVKINWRLVFDDSTED